MLTVFNGKIYMLELVDFVYTMHLLRFYMVDIFLLHLDITIAYPTVSVMHVNQ